MEAKAVAKYLRMSPTKISPVADLVRGKKATEAMSTLEFLPKKGARTLHKLIKSAVANASAK